MFVPSLLALAVGLANLAAYAERIDQERRALEGTWQVISWEKGGVKESSELIKHVRWTFKGNQTTNTKAFCINGVPQRPGGTNEGTYTIRLLDGAKRAEVTTTKVNGSAIPEQYRETNKFIYSLSGNTLRAAGMENGEGVPSKFESKPGSGVHLITLERVR